MEHTLGQTKLASMPLTTKSKKHSRMSSMMDGVTVSSSIFTDRYDKEADRLDWSAKKLTDDHKKIFFACNKYK